MTQESNVLGLETAFAGGASSAPLSHIEAPSRCVANGSSNLGYGC
jgi:hypothetical protein